MNLMAISAVVMCWGMGANADGIYAGKDGPFKTAVVKYEWLDQEREREVPVKIYYPVECNEASAVIIFSHGLGGTRDGYEYVGRYWASWGYVSVHVQHRGSDDEIWRGLANPDDMTACMKKAMMDPRNFAQRPKDVSFAITQMEKLNKEEGLFHGRLDLDKTGVAGHSFGAYASMAVGGQFYGGDLKKSFRDERVKAIVPMSTSVKVGQVSKATYAGIKIPVMHMTGTLDDSPISDMKADHRRIPFDLTEAPEQYLITFEGGDHMIFSGRYKMAGDGSKDQEFQRLIKLSTLAFWDAYLKHDPKAMKWLKEGGLKAVMGDMAQVERK